MTPRFILMLIAGVLLVGAFALTTYDRITTAVMVRCLKTTFGKDGAPIEDLPQCSAKWDEKLGHRATRALFADASGPFGALQQASAMSWACAPALVMIAFALLIEKKRSRNDWLLGGIALGCVLLYLAGYYVALDATGAGDAEGWLAAERRLKAISWMPLAAGSLAVMNALKRRAASRASG